MPQLEPGHRPPTAPPPAPPGGQPRHQPAPPATFRVTIRYPQPWHSRAAAVSDLDPDHAAGGADRDRDRLPRGARAAMTHAVPEQLPSSAASSPHGCPGPSTPAVNARATRARSGRPATVTLPRTAALAISAPAPSPPSPGEIHQGAGRTRRCTPDSAARVKPETHHRSGPSVAVRETADGAHRPSWRPDAVRYASVDTATHRPTVTHRDTRCDKKETARIAENFQLAGRFRRWWQVLGSNQRRLSRRFYRPFPLATRATCRMPQCWRHRKDSRRRDRRVSGIRLSG